MGYLPHQMMVTWTLLSTMPAAIAWRVRPAVSWMFSFSMSRCRCLAAGLCLADHIEVAFGLEQIPETLADDRMILGQEHGDAFHGMA
jgi:hypothetical protein